MFWLRAGGRIRGRPANFRDKDCESVPPKYDSHPGCWKWLITIPAEADRMSWREFLSFTRWPPDRPSRKGRHMQTPDNPAAIPQKFADAIRLYREFPAELEARLVASDASEIAPAEKVAAATQKVTKAVADSKQKMTKAVAAIPNQLRDAIAREIEAAQPLIDEEYAKYNKEMAKLGLPPLERDDDITDRALLLLMMAEIPADKLDELTPDEVEQIAKDFAKRHLRAAEARERVKKHAAEIAAKAFSEHEADSPNVGSQSEADSQEREASPANLSADDAEATLLSLPPYLQRAYGAWLYAEQNLTEPLGRTPKDLEAHDFLKNEGMPDELGDLNDFDNWSRYVRNVRNKLKTRKNEPRAGRSGNSVIGVDQR